MPIISSRQGWSIVRWNLNEAVGNALARGTRTIHIRPCNLDEFVCQNKNPILTKDYVVDIAGIWGEGYYSYPRRSDLKWSEVSISHISWLMPVKG